VNGPIRGQDICQPDSGFRSEMALKFADFDLHQVSDFWPTHLDLEYRLHIANGRSYGHMGQLSLGCALLYSMS